jgi:hypothetical protein
MMTNMMRMMENGDEERDVRKKNRQQDEDIKEEITFKDMSYRLHL